MGAAKMGTAKMGTKNGDDQKWGPKMGTTKNGDGFIFPALRL
jgi:hypothetical protein